MNQIPEEIFGCLPQLERCERIAVGPKWLLIHAPGFEDRTMALSSLVSCHDCGSAILLDYRPFNPCNRLGDVRMALTSKGLSITDADVIAYDRFNPGAFEKVLEQRIREIDPEVVLVDISTMSKLAIILVLRLCAQLEVDLKITYSAAKNYGPTEEEFKEARSRNNLHQPSIQIFTGVHGVVRVGSLASVAMQGQPTAALVFMSFNDLLTQVLLNSVYPTRLLLINGVPPELTWREDATAWIHEQVRREWEEDNPVSCVNGVYLPSRKVSTLDYRDTVSLLISLYWQLSAEYRILLAPAGSKMQAVGCFFAKALHPDIHIEYPSPEGFLPEYSSGIAHSWLLNCGRMTGLLDGIKRAELANYLELAV